MYRRIPTLSGSAASWRMLSRVNSWLYPPGMPREALSAAMVPSTEIWAKKGTAGNEDCSSC